MILPADQNFAADGLLLEMAFQAQHMIAFRQHPRIDRTVRSMASRASLAHRFMLEHKRAALRDVTFAASVLLGAERRAATDHRRSLMRIVTIGATDSSTHRNRVAVSSFEHRMAVGQAELRALVEMTLETNFRRFERIDDSVARAGLRMQAARAMARFATDVLRVDSLRLQSRMRRRFEIARDLGMTFFAALGAGECGTGNLWRHHDGARQRRAGDDDYRANEKPESNRDESSL